MLDHIRHVLQERKLETARRLCLQELASATPATRPALTALLHDALRAEGDLREAIHQVEAVPATSDADRLAAALLLAEDYHRLSEYDFYRGSDYEKRGLTGEQYADLMQADATRYFAAATALATTPELRERVATCLRHCGRKTEADQLAPQAPAIAAESAPVATGSVRGRVRLADGAPADGATVTLGLPVVMNEADPTDYCLPNMHYYPEIGPLTVRTAQTDARGMFQVDNIPAGTQEFLAVTLDPAHYDLPTRFLAHYFTVTAGKTLDLGDLTAAEWHSAPARELRNPFPETLARNGVTWRRVAAEFLKNPFDYDFPRQSVTLELPPGVAANPTALLVLSSNQPEIPQLFQALGRDLLIFTELPARTDRVIALYQAEKVPATPVCTPPPDLAPEPEAGGRTAVIATGRARFRIPWGSATDDDLPPLLAVMAADGVWRGQGRFSLPQDVRIAQRQTTVLEQGPLQLRVEVRYDLSNGQTYAQRFTAHRDEAYLLAHEISPGLAGAGFEFSLREFSGGRSYLFWCPEKGTRSWYPLAREDRIHARLQEQTPWWCPPQGFGHAMTLDSLSRRDYIGVFTIRRGEWIDRDFLKICSGPGDEPAWRRELDWPYPEMVGSTTSMITAHTTATGDAFYRFPLFDGERYWGILASDFALNDGPYKEIWSVQQKNSSPRLEDFRHWRLDEPDHVARPHVTARRDSLRSLREKRNAPAFATLWERILSGKSDGPVLGMRFAVEADPAVAWRKKKEIAGVARIRSRMTLLGRHFADMYCPVGARAITPWAEEYDLIAGSGVFTPEEERRTRQFFMLMGHMHMEPDFMNWKHNGRNANFEADRVDVVGAIGLAFHGNPDAARFVKHAADLMERALTVYCTPGSGKWYENPACYYLHAAKCRMNLAYHLATHGILDSTGIARLKDFLRWGILLLTPNCPNEYNAMRDGVADYAAAGKARRLPPIGDHAGLVTSVPDHYVYMAKLYRKSDPAFADLMLWAWQSSGSGGGDGSHFWNPPLLFAQMEEADLAPAPAQTLTSRRLEGFGAVLRRNFDRDNEFYLLFKQGPGGYRYHRTEGSIILFADGKPLIYDGGEGGETWRHSTLSFYDTHMPLAPGHVEHFHSLPALDFVQGVHPVALKPGQPVFLSDMCNHELVEVALQRYHEPNPADARSIFAVQGEYIVMHDELRLEAGIPSFWHLQVVAHDETGNAADGYRFRGRFGTDLQVLFPGQTFTADTVESHAILEYHQPVADRFAMRHLTVGAVQPDHYLAVLRPLAAGADPVVARALRVGDRTCGVAVTGGEFRDHLFFRRAETVAFAADGIEFRGQYGALLRRPRQTIMALLAPGELADDNIRVESTGPAVQLVHGPAGIGVVAEGVGRVRVHVDGRLLNLDVAGGRIALDLPANAGHFSSLTLKRKE